MPYKLYLIAISIGISVLGTTNTGDGSPPNMSINNSEFLSILFLSFSTSNFTSVLVGVER